MGKTVHPRPSRYSAPTAAFVFLPHRHHSTRRSLWRPHHFVRTTDDKLEKEHGPEEPGTRILWLRFLTLKAAGKVHTREAFQPRHSCGAFNQNVRPIWTTVLLCDLSCSLSSRRAEFCWLSQVRVAHLLGQALSTVPQLPSLDLVKSWKKWLSCVCELPLRSMCFPPAPRPPLRLGLHPHRSDRLAWPPGSSLKHFLTHNSCDQRCVSPGTRAAESDIGFWFALPSLSYLSAANKVICSLYCFVAPLHTLLSILFVIRTSPSQDEIAGLVLPSRASSSSHSLTLSTATITVSTF